MAIVFWIARPSTQSTVPKPQHKPISMAQAQALKSAFQMGCLMLDLSVTNTDIQGDPTQWWSAEAKESRILGALVLKSDPSPFTERVFMVFNGREWIALGGASLVRVTDDEWRVLTNFYSSKITTNPIVFYGNENISNLLSNGRTN